jgi:GT2 family glycosyltransferase
VGALGRIASPAFETIVVVDGSTDGTAAALRALDRPIPLTVIEQLNTGAAAARNRGAAVARGEVLLFLDDDMELDPRALEEHDASYAAGADAVLGHIPVHPESPDSFLARGLSRSVEKRRERLAAPNATLTLFDLLTGYLSVERAIFEELGGFDDQFTKGGWFGDEDLDFGQRLLTAGRRVVFNPRAISHQRYVVTLRAHLRQWSELGHADLAFARKHPDKVEALFDLHHQHERITERYIRPLAATPVLSILAARTGAAALQVLAGARPDSPRLRPLFARVRALHYWRSVHRAGDIPRPRPVRVLAYHAIGHDDAGDVVSNYTVTPEALRRQLRLLQRFGFHFISPSELRRLMTSGGGVPRRAVLLTFDDGYADLADTTLTLLHEVGVPAIGFIVTAHIGGTNVWDQARGMRPRALASAEALRAARHHGLDIGAHSRTHPRLPKLDATAVASEAHGAMADVAALGLPPP